MEVLTCRGCGEQEKIEHTLCGSVYLQKCLSCGNIDFVLKELKSKGDNNKNTLNRKQENI